MRTSSPHVRLFLRYSNMLSICDSPVGCRKAKFDAKCRTTKKLMQYSSEDGQAPGNNESPLNAFASETSAFREAFFALAQPLLVFAIA